MGSSKSCEERKREVSAFYSKSDLIVLFEPTSAPKSTSIFSKPVNLELFPTSSINIVTPNIFELEAMHTAAQENGHFESSQWWSILDSFRISSLSRQGLSRQDVLLIVDIEILLKGMPDLIRVSLIDASPNKAGTAYLAAKNYQTDDRKPYAYRTDDYGATWTKIVNGIPNDDYVQAKREHFGFRAFMGMCVYDIILD